MAAAFGWGTLAASSLVIGAVVALLFRISSRQIGLIMGFGAGVLISAVAFDLVEEAVDMASGHGCGDRRASSPAARVFFGGDWLIDRSGGGERKDATGAQESGSALAIVLGTVLDGIPESMVIGLTIFQGGAVGAAYLAAVFISNLPESISSTAGLAAGGWKKARILWMWIGIALVSGLASLAGYGLFQHSSPDTVAFVLTFAAGAILTMLADTMMPEAYEHGGKLVGVVTTLGFAVAFTIHIARLSPRMRTGSASDVAMRPSSNRDDGNLPRWVKYGTRRNGSKDVAADRAPNLPKGAPMAGTTETPVLDLVAGMTAASIEASSLDAETLMLVRIAALIAVDAPPASYAFNLAAAGVLEIDPEQVRGVLAAVAPIVGTARVASATGNIVSALELAELAEEIAAENTEG